MCVLIVGWVWGGIPSIYGAISSLLFVFIGSFSFAAVGLAATAYARGYEFFSYFFTFWVTPMFIFCGVFFEIDRFPDFIQVLAWLLPMTHLLNLVRPLCLGFPLEISVIIFHVTYVIGFGMLAFVIAYKRLKKRLFD